MVKTIDLIIISASNGKNLELASKFLKTSKDLNLSSELLDLTDLDVPLFNPRTNSQNKIPETVQLIKEKLSYSKKWIICAPEYNGSIPPIFSNVIAWLSISGDDFRELFNGQPIAISTFSGGPGIELLTSLRIQLSHLGSQVLGRQLSASYSKPAEEKSIKDIIKRLLQMKKIIIP